MNRTGILLSRDEISEVNRLLQPKMEINLQRGQTITTIDKQCAISYLQKLAAERGLPTLPDGQTYGVTREGEFVSP